MRTLGPTKTKPDKALWRCSWASVRNETTTWTGKYEKQILPWNMSQSLHLDKNTEKLSANTLFSLCNTTISFILPHRKKALTHNYICTCPREDLLFILSSSPGWHDSLRICLLQLASSLWLSLLSVAQSWMKALDKLIWEWVCGWLCLLSPLSDKHKN